MSKLTLEVPCGDGSVMSIVHPRSFADGGIEWRLRYGNPEEVRFIAASLIDSYDYLLSGHINQKEAERRLRLLRQARRAALEAAANARAEAVGVKAIEAAQWLRDNQGQMDSDGIVVAVSREALETVLNAFASLSILSQGVRVEREAQFLSTEDGEFNGNAPEGRTNADVETIAKVLWHRFSPEHETDWPTLNADEYRRGAADIIAALAHPAVPEGWRPIETAPKDGTEFQGWFDKYGWEPRCRFNPDSEALEIWGRTDYDQEGWSIYIHMTATHWMPLPKPPVAAAEKEGE